MLHCPVSRQPRNEFSAPLYTITRGEDGTFSLKADGFDAMCTDLAAQWWPVVAAGVEPVSKKAKVSK
jgi:hypothetical protein